MSALKKQILVILGNGFDLDIGLKTSYKDFWKEKESELITFCFEINPSVKLNPPLTIYHQKEVANHWFDFEEIMRRYASKTETRNESQYEKLSRVASYQGSSLEGNKKYFEHLKQSLIKYLLIQQDNHPNSQSQAALLLRKINQKCLFHRYICYNFNYTDINIFAKQLGYRSNIEVKHIHGNLKERNIIFGVGEDSLYNGYEFLLKKNQGAKEVSFQEELLKADEVIIFGLAFGRNDIHYFIDFFKNIQNGLNRPIITIYTYNEQEKENIKHRLAEHNIDLSILMSMKILKMISTND